MCGWDGVKESEKSDRPWLIQGTQRSMYLQIIPREKAVGEREEIARCLLPVKYFVGLTATMKRQ